MQEVFGFDFRPLDANFALPLKRAYSPVGRVVLCCGKKGCRRSYRGGMPVKDCTPSVVYWLPTVVSFGSMAAIRGQHCVVEARPFPADGPSYHGGRLSCRLICLSNARRIGPHPCLWNVGKYHRCHTCGRCAESRSQSSSGRHHSDWRLHPGFRYPGQYWHQQRHP